MNSKWHVIIKHQPAATFKSQNDERRPGEADEQIKSIQLKKNQGHQRSRCGVI